MTLPATRCGLHTPMAKSIGSTRIITLENLTGPPLLERATAHPDWLTLTFDDGLDGNSVPAASAFTVTVNGNAVSLGAVEPVVVSGVTVTLALASTLASTDVVAVSYAKPSVSPLRGVDGKVASFSRAVSDQPGGGGALGAGGYGHLDPGRRRDLRPRRDHPGVADLQRGGKRDRDAPGEDQP